MAEVDDRARTPLLQLLTEEAIDRDYQVAASRRASTPGPVTERPGLRLAVVLVVGLFALLVTVAAAQTSANADINDASRASLIQRIESRRAVVRDLQDEIAALREANAAADDSYGSLGSRLADVRARSAELGALTGFEAVTGEGVRITLDNSPLAGENDVVRDSDLALLVDGLWAAGAEAISINGQRLTAASGIRNSGDAIEVNSVGVAPPYTIEAVGDQRSLAANLLETGSGLQFDAIARQFGFEYTVQNDDDLRLRAAPAALQRLQYAERSRNPKLPGGEAP